MKIESRKKGRIKSVLLLVFCRELEGRLSRLRRKKEEKEEMSTTLDGGGGFTNIGKSSIMSIAWESSRLMPLKPSHSLRTQPVTRR